MSTSNEDYYLKPERERENDSIFIFHDFRLVGQNIYPKEGDKFPSPLRRKRNAAREGKKGSSGAVGPMMREQEVVGQEWRVELI